MSEEIPAKATETPLSYEETLAYSQNIRKRIVDKFVGETIPGDEDTIRLVLSALKDMDNTALQDRKNRIDQSNADSSKEVADAMREFVHMQMNRNPFARQPDGSPVATAPSVDVSKLGEFEIVEGEDEIGIIEETSADFMRRMEQSK